ncbi:Serine protease easter [Trachymyrmex septentrionalis]|uniref:Serine protease easter n=1 Tax=Trachymyrmex septentrionalis TaxID=34720 RepID=A0A195FF05_9HYME|nr:Serine protease easter [Trachymyrmex septentrionalis]
MWFRRQRPESLLRPGTNNNTTETSDLENPPNPPDMTNHPNLRLLNHTLCGPIEDTKLLGGYQTKIFQHPWMALISYDTGKPDPEFRCGGTVINSRYVLTAAHCVTFLPTGLRLIGVRVERYQDFGVESVEFHPEYTRTKLQNDIALIRLNSTVDFRPHNVKPICLPFGTATTPHHKKNGGVLQAAGIYNGTSVRMIQYGAVSYGLNQCDTEGFPGVYTNVAYYMDWILNTLTD